MKFKSPVYTQVSGSLAGLTYAHNAGGLYARARAIPTNPNTGNQVAIRNALSAAAASWLTDLTAAQRAAWENYAAATPLTDAFGDPLTLSGQQMFIRSNAAAIRAGLDPVHDGPTTAGVPASIVTALAATDAAADNLSITFNDENAYLSVVGAALIVQDSRPGSAGRNYFRGPFNFLDNVDGAAVAPTSPQTMTSSSVLTAGQRVWIRARVIDATGRLGTPAIFGATVTAAA